MKRFITLIVIVFIIGCFSMSMAECPEQNCVIKYTCPYCKKVLSIKVMEGLFAVENEGKTWMSYKQFLETQKKVAEKQIQELNKSVEEMNKAIQGLQPKDE